MRAIRLSMLQAMPKHGSTLVVNSLADGLACAKEVAADLLK